MVQVNRVCLNIIFINRPQFLVDSNDMEKEVENQIYDLTILLGT